jgi:hypothetical protein
VGIVGWLLAWLILNALFVVWRAFAVTQTEEGDRSLHEISKVADL